MKPADVTKAAADHSTAGTKVATPCDAMVMRWEVSARSNVTNRQECSISRMGLWYERMSEIFH